MYKIIGADQKEYGPITAEQIRQWISEGRLNAQTRACLEGTQEWKPLGSFPEFGFLAGPGAEPNPTPDAGVPVTTEQVLAGDYNLDILGCLGRGWELFKNNFGALVVPALLVGITSIVVSFAVQLILVIVGVNRMPFAERQYLITPVYLVSNALVIFPMLGGFYSICLSLMRRKQTDIGNLFAGFKGAFADLFLAKLVTGLILSACMVPYNIASASKLGPLLDNVQTSPPKDPMVFFSQMFSALTAALPIFVICMIPVTYLTVNWIFTLPLIVDRQMGFWMAMRTSWKVVHKHWFHIFGLVVLTGLINLGGFCVCCVGVLVTYPFTVAAILFAYEDIFGRKTA